MDAELDDIRRQLKGSPLEEISRLQEHLKLELAQKAADAIEAMYQIFADDMRGRIESQTKEIFRKLVWKESHFQDVHLGEDFNLDVIDRCYRLNFDRTTSCTTIEEV